MTDAAPISDDELTGLFAVLEQTPLALAVSGGADSMALMHMVARWAAREDVRAAYRAAWESDPDAPTRPRPSGPSPRPVWIEDSWTIDDLRRGGGPPHVVVLTVDHGLRPGAADEARFVCDEARKLGLPSQILRWEGEKPSTGIQAAAREARRRLLSQVVIDEGRAVDLLHCGRDHDLGGFPTRQIVMAHTQDDQAETFLMRLARGSGLDGLSAMKAREVIGPGHGSWPGAYVWLARPLLGLPRSRLVATLRAEGARWVEDPSNDDERFERVRVRRMLAQLGEVGLTAEKIALSARRLRSVEAGLGYWEQMFVRPRLAEMAWPVYAEVPVCDARMLPGYVGARTLRGLLESYGGSASSAELRQLESLVERAHEMCRRPETGGVTLGGCKIEFLGGQSHRIRVYREGSGEELPVLPIAPGRTVDWDGRRFKVEAAGNAPAGAFVRAMGMQGWVEAKKAVPMLAHLKWPAAAAATLPVVAQEAETIAWPGLRCALDAQNDVLPGVRDAWTAFEGAAGGMFRAYFRAPRWWR